MEIYHNISRLELSVLLMYKSCYYTKCINILDVTETVNIRPEVIVMLFLKIQYMMYEYVK